ncbi:unnamed protein product (macronuclear) [Paramecium tetraurelia]|uniref:Uncharacterized protein n=1 Tax=Paramecium tetraurelia TaxID=5888 RepID=A0E593_PARTE|nr:uncharacterized protein GSPATT00023637001 [Paramecium tetraurelia]CAK90460.1 unnamed protein product [Paramecium tetraurelia]|eukprot:XP_001457857.1 hypothetical protein (macronuclear) [Paramecium tetraurelia strain d4-2]
MITQYREYRTLIQNTQNILCLSESQVQQSTVTKKILLYEIINKLRLQFITYVSYENKIQEQQIQDSFLIKVIYNDYNQFFIGTLMKNDHYRIILQYSQLTLDSLTFPYYHVDKGCQFNFSELDQQIQIQLKQDESKYFKCPVCHGQGQLLLDFQYIKEEYYNKENQFAIKMEDQQTFILQKSSYFDSILSKEQKLFELQKQFNSRILSDNHNQNKFTLQLIENLNAQRNNEIFQIYRKSRQEQQPTLIGVINFKLILFYHAFKIKIELDLYDDTNKNNRIKLADFQYGQMTTYQVSLINKVIYLVVQQDKLYQLYRGNFNQIFEGNQDKPIFNVSIMPGYTLLGVSRLFQFNNHILMIGSKAGIVVKDKIDEKVAMDGQLKIPKLTENSQFAAINNRSILFAGNNQIDKSVGIIKELFFSESKIIETQENTFKIPNSELDFSLLIDDAYYLLSSEKLNQQKVKVIQITATKDRNLLTRTMKIINHHSYLKVKIIPTTNLKVGSVVCAMVGLTFENSQTILPGVLVFNDKDNIIEIELI